MEITPSPSGKKMQGQVWDSIEFTLGKAWGVECDAWKYELWPNEEVSWILQSQLENVNVWWLPDMNTKENSTFNPASHISAYTVY